MSYYVHNKAVRLLVNKSVLQKLGCNNETEFYWSFESLVANICPALSKSNKTPYFTDESGETQTYIDLVLYHTIGEECGEWAYAHMLSSQEAALFVPLFNQLGLDVKSEDLRKVDYCYYNSIEAPDCFDTGGEDYTRLFFNRN